MQTDGYSGYNFLDRRQGIVLIGCWGLSRRGFMDVIKAQGKNRKNGAADKALSYIRKMYKFEREAKKNALSFEQIYQMRQEEVKPLLEDFKKWLNKKVIQTPAQGLPGKAVTPTL